MKSESGLSGLLFSLPLKSTFTCMHVCVGSPLPFGEDSCVYVCVCACMLS